MKRMVCTARIYPEQAVVEAKALDIEMIRLQLQAFLDEYNKNQPTYRRITGLRDPEKIRLYAVQQRKSGDRMT